jgi:hypothetical protein
MYSNALEPLPGHLPWPLGNVVSACSCVDLDHAGCFVTFPLHSGMLDFANGFPTSWYSKE